MNKIILGLLLGGLLGIVDGLTAWFTPEVRPMIVSIVIGSTFKGIIAGVAAGWFARKVKSIPAGIAFGFAVGLLLAFLVAAMPSGTGKHYYFAIMLPGSILGAVVGWATQRYGQPARSGLATASMLLIALVAPTVSRAAEPTKADPPITATAAFERMKTLNGSWKANAHGEGVPATINYRVTGGGSAIMETLFPGTSHEMITMYTLDGDNLQATHYCAAGNQPTLKLDLAHSTPDDLVFSFVSVAGRHGAESSYMSGARFHFGEKDHVESEWSSTDDGKPGDTHRFVMQRP